MIINIHQGHDAFLPSDDAGVASTKKVNMFPFNRSPYSRKQQSINCEPVTKVKELLCIHTSYIHVYVIHLILSVVVVGFFFAICTE